MNVLSKCMNGWQSGAERQRVDANPMRGDEGIAANIQRICIAFDRFDAWDDILRLSDFDPECMKAERGRRLLDPLNFQRDERAIDIAKDGHSIESGHDFTQQFKSKAAKIGRQVRQTGDIAARARQAGDQPGPDRVSSRSKYDWDCRRRFLDGHGSRGACRDDDIDLALNKFGRERVIAVIPPFRPAIFDCDVAAIDPAELAQALQKSSDECTPDRWRSRTQESNRWRLARLLGARRMRSDQVRHRLTAQDRKEFPPPHVRPLAQETASYLLRHLAQETASYRLNRVL